jgi:hypothetical protein
MEKHKKTPFECEQLRSSCLLFAENPTCLPDWFSSVRLNAPFELVFSAPKGNQVQLRPATLSPGAKAEMVF